MIPVCEPQNVGENKAPEYDPPSTETANHPKKTSSPQTSGSLPTTEAEDQSSTHRDGSENQDPKKNAPDSKPRCKTDSAAHHRQTRKEIQSETETGEEKEEEEKKEEEKEGRGEEEGRVERGVELKRGRGQKRRTREGSRDG